MLLREALQAIWSTGKRHAVLVGAGGSGKSCLVRDLARDPGGPVALYIDLAAAHGEHFILSEILKRYTGAPASDPDGLSRKTLLELFGTPAEGQPAFLLILDGIDDADKRSNPSLHRELDELSGCAGLQLVLTVRTLSFLKTNYYFEGLAAFTELSMQQLSPEVRDAVLSKALPEGTELTPAFLEVLRRPMFLSVYLELLKDREASTADISSARALFAAVIAREIGKQANQDGQMDKAVYAFHYLLPALANALDQYSFTGEELREALYRAYYDTAYANGGSDGIASGLLAGGSRAHHSREFRSAAADAVFESYVEKIFLPRGYLVKDGAAAFRFSHRNWMQYFQMEHLFNCLERAEKKPKSADIPGFVKEKYGKKRSAYKRENLLKSLPTVWEEAMSGDIKPEQEFEWGWIAATAAVIAAVVLAVIWLRPKPPAPEPLHIVLTPEEMTLSEYASAVQIIHERLDILADGTPYAFTEEDNTLVLDIPESVFFGHVPVNSLRQLVAMPVELYLLDASSGYPRLESIIRIRRSDVENARILSGSVEGADPAQYGTGPEPYEYIEITLTKEWVEKNKSTYLSWDEVELGQDVIYDNSYYSEIFLREEGRILNLFVSGDPAPFTKAFVYDITHPGLANEFSVNVFSPLEWEDPADAIKAGALQCTPDRLPASTVDLIFETHASDRESGAWLDTLNLIKRRMDVIGAPYAIALQETSYGTLITVRTDAFRLGPYVPYIQHVLCSTNTYSDEFLLHGLTSYHRYSGKYFDLEKAEWTVLETPDGYAVRIALNIDSAAPSFAEYADAVLTDDDPYMLFSISDFPLLMAAAADIIGDHEIIFRHFYGAPDLPITAEDAWLLNLIMDIYTEKAGYPSLYVNSYDFHMEEGVVEPPLAERYAAENENIREAVLSVHPDASVKFAKDTVGILLGIDVDEDLPKTAAALVEKISTSFDFEHSRFSSLAFYLIEEDDDRMERARIFIQKDYENGALTGRGIFGRGRLNKYQERFKGVLEQDDFFATIRNNMEYPQAKTA